MPTKRGTKSKKSGTSKAKAKTEVKSEVKNKVIDDSPTFEETPEQPKSDKSTETAKVTHTVEEGEMMQVDDLMESSRNEEVAPKTSGATLSPTLSPTSGNPVPLPPNLMPNTASIGDEVKLLLLENHQLEMKNFYMRSSRNRIAPKKPKSPVKLAEELGNGGYAQIIQEWNAKMIQRFRPKRGYVLPDVETPQQILGKLK